MKKSTALLLSFIYLMVFTPAFLFTTTTPVYAATTPSLGQADSFGILSGTFTNTVGGTTINGDLGYTTGPAMAPTVNGTIYSPPSGKYSTAGTDQDSALVNLNGQACTHTFPAGAVDLASDTSHGTIGVYAPGVYCTAASSAASIGTGGITLSGSGTYIFKINGALTTAANSVVTLTGASACNVFWIPTEATTLGANSTFAGTDIDAAGITIGSTTTWTGRALAFGGAVSTTTDTITVPTCTTPTPTPTPTSTPTSTPTPTPSPTTSPAATPTPTPAPSSTSGSTSSSNNSSSCTSSGITTIPTIIQARRISPVSIYVSWGPDAGVNNFIVQYGFENGKWLFNTKVFGFSATINDLPANRSIWIRVAATDNCAIGTFGKSVFVVGTLASNSPGFPNTGNPLVPGLPNTGIAPKNKNTPWNILAAVLFSFAIFYLAVKKHKKILNSKKKLISILLFVLIFGAGTKSVLAQTSPSVLYVPLIGLTSVPEPLALPEDGGKVIYKYAVKNFLTEVALTDVQVVDDKCNPVKFITGDDDGDSKLDYSETWRYICTTKLSQTTQSTATATGTTSGITARHKAYATVIVGSNNPPPLVSIINVTKVAYPLSLPVKGGKITFTYKVNNPGVVPLSNVTVDDDKCSAMSGKLGDTNGNNLLDINEVWIYTCTAILTQTTTNTVNVTAFANGLKAVADATITVKVDTPVTQSSPNFPDAGINPDLKISIWRSLSSILTALIIFFVLTRKSKLRKNGKKPKSIRSG